jgi:hypothetical protein
LRAAPAKKATLSMVPGTSKPVARRIGLPVWRLSVRASSSAWSASTAASRVSAADRSTGGASDQAGNAARAAATAASTSPASASTTCSRTSPVAGSVTSKTSPEPPCRRRPAMIWCTRLISSVGDARSSVVVRGRS